MDLLLIQTPWIQLIAKIILVLLLLLAMKRCQFSAATHALVWRFGLLVLLLLPWANTHVSVFELPLLPASSQGYGYDQAQPSVKSIVQPQLINSGTDGYSLPLWLFMVASISTMLILRMARQIHQLKQITKTAQRMTNPAWQRIAEHCSNQMKLTKAPDILTTAAFKSPCTWGYLKPVVLIPENISDQDTFRLVLLHELAHIKRKDWVWMMMAQLFTAVFWFNPVLWWVKSQLIQSFEKACDELVLQQHIQPSHYAETLLSFHAPRQQNLTQVTTLMAQPSAMYQRLSHILNPHKRSQIMNSNKQNLLLFSASLTTLLITASQLTFAHEATVIEHAESPPKVAAQVPARPATPGKIHLATPAIPSPNSAVAPPRPNSIPALPAAVKPHTDGVVAPHPAHAPAAKPVVPHADHLHDDTAVEYSHELAEHEAAEVSRMAKAHALKKRLEAEEMLQLKQVELNQMAQQQAMQKAEIKQQLAKIEIQKRQLEAQLKRQEAQMAERIEFEKAQVRKEMKALEMAQVRIEQAMKMNEQKNNQQ